LHASDVQQRDGAFAHVLRQFEKTAVRTHIDGARGDASDENRNRPHIAWDLAGKAAPSGCRTEHAKHDAIPHQLATGHDSTGGNLHAKRDAPSRRVPHLNRLFARCGPRGGNHGDLTGVRPLNLHVLHEPQRPMGAGTDEPTGSPPI
jgi:hypothetical protein